MKSNEHFIILEYPKQILLSLVENNKNICLWEDVFKELGLFYIFQTYNLSITDEDDRFNYHLIRMNENNLKEIEVILKQNLLKTSRKDIKFYNKEGRLRKFSWNAFYCAPYTHPEKTANIAGLEVWIPKHYIPATALDKIIDYYVA